jgi:hypothetical protein
MKTYNKKQFIEKFGDKKDSIAFVYPYYEDVVYNISDVEDIWKFIDMLPGEAVFDVYSFSAGLSNNNVLQKTFNEDVFGYYGEKRLDDYRNLEDNGDDIFVALICDYYSLRKGIVASQYPYEVTAEMIRRALGKSCSKLLDLREKQVRGIIQRVETPYYTGRADFATRQEAQEVVAQEVKEYQSYIRGVLRRCKEIDTKGLSLEEGAKMWLKYQKQLKKEQEKEQKAREKAKEKARKAYESEQKRVSMMIDGYFSVFGFVIANLRTGEHTGRICGRIADENNIVCDEERDFDGYSRRCKFAMIRRFFTLNIKKGFRVRNVGGLITFYKGEFNRQGMKVEWIEQGRSIADITKHTGYLVRGEHIEAKSLREAVRINEEHRAMKLARILSKRKRAERREEEKQNGSLKITFADSLNAGNCRPGTQEFKHKYEEAIGHKATSISIADLRKYAKQFGVEYYAEQAIEYALNH